MKPRISVLTLGVADLERSLHFYRDGLGLPTEGIVGREFEHGAVAFFDLAGGLKLALWAQDDLAHDTGLPSSAISSTAGSIGHNVLSRQEVDDIMHEAERAGAFRGQAAAGHLLRRIPGYFADPDGHLWEVVWNPQMLPMDWEYPRYVPAFIEKAGTCLAPEPMPPPDLRQHQKTSL